jgi:hypothetical protein
MKHGMEISLQKTEGIMLDPRRGKAAQHSIGGSTQSAQQPTALMPLLSLLLIVVLAIALPLPPAVCVLAATGLGLCCFMAVLGIRFSISYSLSSLPQRSSPPSSNSNSPPPLVQYSCAGMS